MYCKCLWTILGWNHIAPCSVCWNLITKPCMMLPVPIGNNVFNHVQAWKTEYQVSTNIILLIKKDLPFISARGNTFTVAIFKSMVVSVHTV